jgi:hypothetical protein
MLEFLTVLLVVVLLVVTLTVTTAVLAVRRVRRSRLVATGRDLVSDGRLALTASGLRGSPGRAAALRGLQLSREHRLLRQQVAAAQQAGAHLGDVPKVLPRLEAEGRRLRAALGQAALSPVPAPPELLARTDRHRRALAALSEAVGTATALPATESTVAADAEEAALALRLHTAAYTELTTPPTTGVPGGGSH